MFIFIFRLFMLFILLFSPLNWSISKVFLFFIFGLAISGLLKLSNLAEFICIFAFHGYLGLLSPLSKVQTSVDDLKKEIDSSSINNFLEHTSLSCLFSTSSNFTFYSNSTIFCEFSSPASTLSIKTSD